MGATLSTVVVVCALSAVPVIGRCMLSVLLMVNM